MTKDYTIFAPNRVKYVGFINGVEYVDYRSGPDERCAPPWVSTEPNGAYPATKDITRQYIVNGLDVTVTLPDEIYHPGHSILSIIVLYGRNY